MSSKFFQLKSYFSYWLDAVDEHSLHSPFLFELYTKVLHQKSARDEFDTLRKFREELLRDERAIHVTDFGAGSLKLKSNERKISDIARVSTTPEKYSTFYARLLKHYCYSEIIELGTSVGINAMYLAMAHPATHITTFEGSSEIAHVARTIFQKAGLQNITIIEGNIDKTLPSYLDSIEKFDFALMDANHRIEPTIRYLEMLSSKTHSKSVIVMDDIHNTIAMENAWNATKQSELVYTTVDLFRCGLVFFNPALTKQNAVLRF